MQNSKKNLVTWLLIFAAVMLISNLLGGSRGVGINLIFSDFIKSVDTGNVSQVDIKGKELSGTLRDGSKFYTELPEYPDLVEKLQSKNVEINALPLVSRSEKIIAGLLGWLP